MRERLSVSAALLRLFQTGLLLGFITGIVNLPKRLRRYVLFASDSIIFLVAACIAINLRFEDVLLRDQLRLYQDSLALIVPVKFCIFYLLGMYRPLLRHTGSEVLWLALKSVILSEAGLVAFSWLLNVQVLPRSVQIISALITWIGVVGIRFSIRRFFVLVDTAPRRTQPLASRFRRRSTKSTSTSQRIIIYGAGSAGFQLSQALMRETDYQVVAFVDDNFDIHGRSLDQIQICSPTLLRTLIAQHQVAMVLLAVPSASPQDKRRILQSLKGLPVKVKTVPSVREIVAGQVPIGQLRNVDISDLLGREEVLPDPSCG
jgi:FlaA1/EpsC-like NDP-sugar epimerase